MVRKSPSISWTRAPFEHPRLRHEPASAPERVFQSPPTRGSRRRRTRGEEAMEVLYPRCAGLDVHKATVVACVRVARGGGAIREVRSFATTTAGLIALSEWL